MSLIRASRCRPAPSTRSSGSRSCLDGLGILPQHLADADDGVERRAQLVAHVGEELRLVLARLCELAALLLDFLEQPHVLDRDRRLIGEGRYQFDLLVGKRPYLGPRQGQHADGTPREASVRRAWCDSLPVFEPREGVSGSASTSGI